MLDRQGLRQRLATRNRHQEMRGKKSAVLVPIAGDALLFTKRPDTLRHHAGQVSFPGGSVDPVDRDQIATALREANEELGLVATDIDVLGLLDDLYTPSDYCITPIVGVLATQPTLVPSAVEVEAAFWVNIDRLRQPELWHAQTFPFEGGFREAWFFSGAEYTIWGATAAIVRQFLSIL